MGGGPCLLQLGESPIQDAITRIRFAPSSNNLLISSWDSKLRVYDFDQSILRVEIPCEVALLDCCFQNELFSFTSGSDGSVTRYDLHSGKPHLLGTHADLASCVEYASETGEVLSAGWDKMIRSWDPRIENPTRHSKDVQAEVKSMSVSSVNLMVAAETSVLVFDLRYFDQPVQAKQCLMDFRIKCLRSFPDSRGFVTGSVDGRVTLDIVQPIDTLDKGYTFWSRPKSKGGKKYLGTINDIAVNPGALGTIVTGSNDGYVIGWNGQSRKRLFELPRFPNSIAGLSYNHDGQLLAIASSHTYHEAKENEEEPKLFVQALDNGSVSLGSSARN